MKRSGRLRIEGMSIFQWFVFLLANGVAIPIVVGEVYQLPVEEMASLMQRTFFIMGVSTLLQVLLGHKLPIVDGPAGIWVGVIVIMANMAVQLGHDLFETLQMIAGGMIIAGLILAMLGMTGLIRRILTTFFTPLVTGSFLLLLSLQLSGVFIKGMVGYSDSHPQPDYTGFIIAFFVFITVIACSAWGTGWLRSYALVIGILIGWLVFYLAGERAVTPGSSTWLRLPEMFAWGMPHWNIGMVISSAILVLILVSNMIANMSATALAMGDKEIGRKEYNRGVSVGGISQILSGLFSIVAVVPFNSSAGFIRMTGESRRRPLMAACLFLILISFIPPVVDVLAMLPGPVANAAMLGVFVQSVGVAVRSVLRSGLDDRRMTIFGITLLLGVGSMFMPSTVFQGLPSVVRYVCGNGLIVGTIIVILLEKCWIVKTNPPVDQRYHDLSS